MSDKPNILFILADDLGAWAMGCAGNNEVITPNIDRLAASGVRFENFFCASPVCSPARASILTGLMPSRHGVHDWLRSGNIDINKLNDNQRNSGWYNEEKEGIEYIGEHITYTEILAKDGYSCAMSGKWHLGNSHRPQKGFTRWNVLARGGCNYYGSDMAHTDGVYISEGYITDTITDNALDFLDEISAKPFYLGVHYTAPHTPWNEDQHPADIWKLYDDCPFESAPSEPPHRWQAQTCQIARTEEERRRLLRGYYTAITAMDANIGRILRRLDQKGLTENTLVVFMGDNGMNLGHHGIWGKGNGTFPMNMYDTSVKVPLIMSHPGKIPAGETRGALLSQYDFMPTLLEYTSNADKIPAILPGHGFLDILLNGERSSRDNRAVYVFDEYGPVRMIRDTAYKYVHRYPYGEHELYDLRSDPDERNNLAEDAAYRDVKAEYKHRLDLWFLANSDPKTDGSREAVTGFGQMGHSGIGSGGYTTYRR
ncbi:MAG: sulfatase-like hydrolase/transferase [Eubacteriales bacterium]|jgi:choline-sulfatase|nr:sulfatase-like hydrolase/transferase [Eubacteriales bacterium]